MEVLFRFLKERVIGSIKVLLKSLFPCLSKPITKQLGLSRKNNYAYFLVLIGTILSNRSLLIEFYFSPFKSLRKMSSLEFPDVLYPENLNCSDQPHEILLDQWPVTTMVS
jgi:hypothetical protein